MPENKSLKMSFDPHTIEHLGVKMYSNIPNAIAELIANAYDADASNVFIKLYDQAGEKRIEVIDDGEGMSFQDINNQFLRIGRKRREEGFKTSPSGQRKVTGKKGLGKLAFFGIGNTIEIITTKKGSGKKVFFTLDWNELLNTHGRDYEPKFKVEDCDLAEKGTSIILKDLKRKSAFGKEELAISISKLFNLFDNTFMVFVSLNDDEQLQIDDKLKYQNIESQFEWNFPDFCQNVGMDYSEKQKISGKIISTEKPLKPGLRGITLFANGRLVNAPEFFGVSESSHGFSYFTGWLDVDFVDDWTEDVISTDRQSLNWDLSKTAELREFLKKTMSELERKWRERRNENRKEKIKEKTQVDVANWYKNLPEEILTNIEPVINSIIERSELGDDEQSDVVQRLHSLVPEYPYYHWRHLHSEIHSVSRDDYQKADFLRAAIEAIKKFEQLVCNKTGLTKNGVNLMETAFGSSNSVLLITNNQSRSEQDLENGQESLSKGVIQGFRNPVSHEFKNEIFPKIFNDKDCLDILSLTSYLIRKLEQANKRT